MSAVATVVPFRLATSEPPSTWAPEAQSTIVPAMVWVCGVGGGAGLTVEVSPVSPQAPETPAVLPSPL